MQQQEEVKLETEEESLRKHSSLKESHMAKINMQKNSTMKHYLNCGFNLLIYGVGSKRDFINNFAQTCLSGEPLLYVNGFHSGANMKAITNPMVNFAIKH